MIQQSENFLLKWPSLEEGEWERILNKLKKKKKSGPSHYAVIHSFPALSWTTAEVSKGSSCF